jgi:AraC-like DNA-binding protein
MSDIAGTLGVSPSLLSQVFTLYLKEPYYDYINKYRLEEFKKLIQEGRHKQFTITALSEQCGFKKTSFFSTFRKVEGTTPTEWIQRIEK